MVAMTMMVIAEAKPKEVAIAKAKGDIIVVKVESKVLNVVKVVRVLASLLVRRVVVAFILCAILGIESLPTSWRGKPEEDQDLTSHLKFLINSCMLYQARSSTFSQTSNMFYYHKKPHHGQNASQV